MTLLTKRKPRPKANTQPVVRTRTVPAPIRGLNYRDALAALKPTDALILDDVVCRPSYVEVRAGWIEHVTAIPDPVETLFPYTDLAGDNYLFAAAGADIYDVTVTGAVGAAVVTGFLSAYWAQTQFSNLAGNFLIIVNGVDDAQIYDGTTWGVLGVTGVPITDLTQVAVWKRRLWFVEKDTNTAWYGAVDAISGALTAFPLAGIFRLGGHLKAVINWTIDGGEGLDDYLLFVNSEGEVAVYKGTDPSAAATFGLVGRFYIGAPIGERFYAQYGGDVLLLTVTGVIPFSKYLQSQAVDRTKAISNRIDQLIASDAAAYGGVRGWEILTYFDQNLLIIQVPSGDVGARYQYAMSTLTGAWSRLLFKEAITFAVSGSSLYHGQSTLVADSWRGGTNNGEAIQYKLLPAFSDFGLPTVQKLFTLGRITFQADQKPNFQVTTLIDYNQEYNPVTIPDTAAAGSFWGVALWGVAVWGGLYTSWADWYSLNNIGYTGSQIIQGASVGSVTRIVAMDYVFQPGALL